MCKVDQGRRGYSKASTKLCKVRYVLDLEGGASCNSKTHFLEGAVALTTPRAWHSAVGGARTMARARRVEGATCRGWGKFQQQDKVEQGVMR